MRLTASQLGLLRSRPHQTQLFLSIYRPKTLMAAQVASGTYNVGDAQIGYMSVSTGSYLNLYPDLTVLVGTNPGEDDYGRIRMRSATGTYTIFAENAINWSQGQYLTYIDYIDITAIYPRIIQDPNNQTNVIFYKDYDIPYSNQNQIYGTFINAGPHRAGFISSGTFFFSATGSHNVNDESLTWSWNFEGGTPTGSTSETPGNVKWNTPGHYKVKIRATSSSGAVDEAYRYVSMYDRLGQGNNPPISRWELQSLNGSRTEGGYTASFKVYDNIGDVQPNALVVMFGETKYGGTPQNIGGNSPNNSGIYYVGYILGDSIKFNYQYSYVEFSVGSVTELMKQAEGFSVSCESKASPTTWFELYEMTVERAIYHYLRWHSTVLRVTDFQYLGDNRLVQYFDADRGSLYDAVDSFVRDGLLGETIADRQGKIWAEISSFGLETPFSSIADNMTFYRQDWMNDPTIEERRNYELSFIELGGIAYYGVSSNAFSALLSNAPSTVPLYHGKADRKEGMILNSQAQVNQISGNYLAHNNTKFPNISMSLAGCYLNLDIVPQEKNYLLIQSSDTIRNKSILNFPYIVNSMEWKYSPVHQSFYPDISLLEIATGTAGVTVEIPVAPPDNGYSYPGINLPPLPGFNDSPGVGATIPSVVLFHDGDFGVVYTLNFDSNNPQYFTMNGGLTQAQYQNIDFMGVCPNGSVYVARRSQNSALAFVARAPSVGAPFSIVVSGVPIWGMGIDTTSSERVMIVRAVTTTGKTVYVGAGTSYVQGVTLSSLTPFTMTASFGLNQWLIMEFNKVFVVSSAGTSAISSSTPSVTGYHSRATGSGIVITNDSGGTGDLIISTNNFNTYDTVVGANVTWRAANENMNGACDTSGLFLMSRWSTGQKGRSSDGGYTWTALPNLPPSSGWYFAYAGSGGSSPSASRWIAVSGGNIRFSPDLGNTWLNREGNITSINPFPTLNMVCPII